MPAFLKILSEPWAPHTLALDCDRPILVGRGEGCDLRIDDASLSRFHCTIECQPGGWRLSDSKSTNGTHIDDFRVSETIVVPGEILQIGDIRLEFVVDDAADLPTISEGESAAPLAGRHFGPYELLRLIRTGAHSSVYQVRDAGRNRELALKLLHRERSNQKRWVRRLQRGVRAAAQAAQQHAAIVKPVGIGRLDGRAFATMELIDGTDLGARLDELAALSVAETVQVGRAIAGALDAVARLGIVHRNVTPSNILLARDGRSLLGDFLLARAADPSPADQLTLAGESLGDPAFTAPECAIDSSRGDCRSDVYSLGVCLYRALAGRLPFNSDRSGASARTPGGAVPSLRAVNPQISEPLETAVFRCLALNPDARFQTPQQLVQALEQLGDVSTFTSVPNPSSAAEPAGPVALPDDCDEHDPTGSLPESLGGLNGSWRRFLIIPKATWAPAARPWSTLFATVIVVVGVGSLVMFGGRRWFGWAPNRAGDAVADANVSASDSTGAEPGFKPDINRISDANRNAGSSELSRGPRAGPGSEASVPAKLVVEPGTPLRTIADALDAAADGQTIEVASSEPVQNEIRMPGKSLRIAAHPEFQPVLRNTLRIDGGGTIRIEGIHFEPYTSTKPAIEIAKMPDKLELVGCTFRASEGALIVAGPAAAAARPRLELERCYVAGNVLLSLNDVPPDIRISQSCLVADQSVFDWRLAPNGSYAAARCAMLLHRCTVVARSVWHVQLDDQAKPVRQFPNSAIDIADSMFVFPTRYPGTFFKWESWRQPDIPMPRISWSGRSNVFSGLGAWSMATARALSNPAAAPVVALKTPTDWQDEWAVDVEPIWTLPPAFVRSDAAGDITQLRPRDFELLDKAKQREIGGGEPLGADVRALPNPPEP